MQARRMACLSHRRRAVLYAQQAGHDLTVAVLLTRESVLVHLREQLVEVLQVVRLQEWHVLARRLQVHHAAALRACRRRLHAADFWSRDHLEAGRRAAHHWSRSREQLPPGRPDRLVAGRRLQHFVAGRRHHCVELLVCERPVALVELSLHVP